VPKHFDVAIEKILPYTIFLSPTKSQKKTLSPLLQKRVEEPVSIVERV
jgi:hypothetical protein